ncbi:cold-shock protein [Moheibacter stercoris]|uniref:Cold shock CspA family protein n=1 Tax=Moheibacter stercoris TaxID=1628251 RepID=A0ABV2LT49_9FLAO
MSDSFSKKENLKKRADKKKEKALKREERKTQNNKGKSLESMFAYVDEFGRITSTPPDQSKKEDINLDDIQLGAAPIEDDAAEAVSPTGVVTYFSDKGYGFITDDKTKNNIFFHMNEFLEPIKLKDKVQFEIKKTPRGDNATQLKKI